MAICTSTKLYLSPTREKATLTEFKSVGRGIRICRPSISRPNSLKLDKRKGHLRRQVSVCVAKTAGKAVDRDQDGTALIVDEGTDKKAPHGLENGFSPSSNGSFTSDHKNGSHASPNRIAFDYGFQAKFLRKGPTVPGNVIKLAFENFGREWKALRRSYLFGELEKIDMDTYGQFVDENEKLLKTLPPSPVAVEYYEGEDLYMYDEFQTSRLPETRRPKIDSLYDVFAAIAGDEFEHVKTMVACQQLDTWVVSPHKAKITGENPLP